jgi:S-DNA-T family DNA segregation ATPase FtsK/SpoIIIE
VDLDLRAAARTPTGVRLPVGLDVRTASSRTISLDAGSSLLVLGPARSGRSSLLLALAQAIAAADPTITRYSVAPRPTPLDATDLTIRPRDPAGVADWVDAVAAGAGPAVVLVDDADRLDGPSFERLAEVRRDDITFVVAGTPDGLRAITHWARPLLRTRTGILLKPTPNDGDLLRVQLAPRLARMDVGRGLLVDDGDIVPLLVARPVPTATVPPRR